MIFDTEWAFGQYEQVRDLLPDANFPIASQRARNLAEIADLFDVFLLDAFGVLNVGETAIAGAPERIADLQAAGKQVFVLSNAASLPVAASVEKYRKLGFDFAPDHVISSRDALVKGLLNRAEENWGVMAITGSRIDLLPANCVELADDPAIYDRQDGFILLASGEWTEARQEILIASLQ